jgi:hypothetical protein
MKGLWCLYLVFALVACSSEIPSQIDTVMEDGVEVVLNHIEPYRIKGETARLTIDRDFSIDFEREDLAEMGVSEILDYDVDSSGSIYCLCDAGVFKFAPNGNFLVKFSRKGQGPGELNYPTKCGVSGLDEFWVFDYSKRKFIHFDREGNFLKETDFKVQGNTYGIQADYLNETTDMQLSAPPDMEEASPVYQLILQNTDSGETKTLPEQLEGESPTRNPRHNLLHERLLYQTAQGNIYVYSQQNPEFEINVYDFEGTPLKRVRKQYQKVKIDEEFKTRRMEWFKKHPMSRLHKMQGYFPEFYPPIKDFCVDSKGRLFVEPYEKGEDPDKVVVDVFNPEGVYIDRTSLAQSLSKRFKNERLYALHEKNSGFQELIVSILSWD